MRLEHFNRNPGLPDDGCRDAFRGFVIIPQDDHLKERSQVGLVGLIEILHNFIMSSFALCVCC